MKDQNILSFKKFQVLQCTTLVSFLSNHFDDRRRYKFNVVGSVSNDVTFKRLTSNISQVRVMVDDFHI